MFNDDIIRLTIQLGCFVFFICALLKAIISNESNPKILLFSVFMLISVYETAFILVNTMDIRGYKIAIEVIKSINPQ